MVFKIENTKERLKRGDQSWLFCRHASGVVDDKQNIKLATAEGLAALLPTAADHGAQSNDRLRCTAQQQKQRPTKPLSLIHI